LLIHKYLGDLFLKLSFSSRDAVVLTCTFLGTFCLKPHLRRIQGLWEYSDILYFIPLFFTINSSTYFVVQPCFELDSSFFMALVGGIKNR
jgi:hypothetical protein